MIHFSQKMLEELFRLPHRSLQ